MIEFQSGEYLYAICSETHKHNTMYADNKIHHLQTRISPECYLTAVSQDDTWPGDADDHLLIVKRILSGGNSRVRESDFSSVFHLTDVRIQQWVRSLNKKSDTQSILSWWVSRVLEDNTNTVTDGFYRKHCPADSSQDCPRIKLHVLAGCQSKKLTIRQNYSF